MKMTLRPWLLAALLVSATCFSGSAQVVGGQRAFEYLRLSPGARTSALGGINVSDPATQISAVAQNPALMRPGLHNQLAVQYNNYHAGINILNLQHGYHSEKWNTSFSGNIQYLNYGSFDQTDPYGNTIGTFRGTDFAVSLGASKQYKERWRGGVALKYAGSRLADLSAGALLADVGVSYADTERLITIGAVAKNIGFMTHRYNTANTAEPLPFDLQIGFSKRLARAPLRFHLTAHHLYKWDVRYDNPADIVRSTLSGASDSSNSSNNSGNQFFDKLARHLIVGADILIGKHITVTAAYNHLRRGELALTEKGGLAGFSFGGTVHLNRFQVSYARGNYHLAGATNEFGLHIDLNKTVGIGGATERLRWNKVYPDWRN